MPKVLSDAELATIAAFGGWAPGSKDLTIAVAVSLAENQNSDPKIVSPKNRNGTVDIGLWQINSVHGYPEAQLKEGIGNARAAYEVFLKQGWGAWSTYKSGAYLLFMPRATAAVKHGGTGGVPAGTGQGTAPTLTTLDVAMKTISGVGGWVGNPNNWLRVLYVITGSALVIGGLVVVARNSATVSQVKKAVR